MSSVFGKKLKISIFGQSHSEAVGVTIDGLPAGRRIDIDKLNTFMKRREPGNNSYSTARHESDIPEFLSGIVDGITCGAPLTCIIRNRNTRSQDYDNLRDVPRPSHADYTADIKYGGYQDVSGGGHFSGRLTAPLCIAGGICKQLLSEQGVRVSAHIKRIRDIEDESYIYGEEEDYYSRLENSEFPVLNENSGSEMKQCINKVRLEQDSVGGVIECVIDGLPAGVGSPMFDGLENIISQAVFAIPAVKGIEFGCGFECTTLLGSQNNDEFCISNDGRIKTRTNNHGGILGGISSGMPIVFRAAVKPTPSIGKEQRSVRLSDMSEEKLIIKGRHDPCIVPRAVPCVEAAAAVAVYDMMIICYD